MINSSKVQFSTRMGIVSFALGCFLLLVGIVGFVIEVNEAVDDQELSDLTVAAMLVIFLAVFLIYNGFQIFQRISLLKKYDLLIRFKKVDTIATLAYQTSKSPVFVKKQLQIMINKKLFVNAYIGSGFKIVLLENGQVNIYSAVQDNTINNVEITKDSNVDSIGDNDTSKNVIDFDNMDGWEFENFCANILINNDFSDVEVTKGSGDFGADVFAQKDGNTYVFQCKRHASNIGNSAVQEIFTAKTHFNKDIAVVITNRYFTKSAIETAEKTRVKLWDRDKLNELITSNTISS